VQGIFGWGWRCREARAGWPKGKKEGIAIAGAARPCLVSVGEARRPTATFETDPDTSFLMQRG